SAGVRRHAGGDDAGDPLDPARRLRQLRRRAAWREARWRGTVLRARAPAWRSRPGAPLLAAPDRPRVGPEDQPRQGLRSDPPARAGGRGLPRDGRAPRDQDAAATAGGEPMMPKEGRT